MSDSADSKGGRTRRRILDAAAAEIARHGLAGASLRTIAAAAGLKTGSVYFHFDSKEQLFAAVLEEGLHRTLEHLDAASATLPADTSAVGRLRAAITAHAVAVNELRAYTVVVLAPDPIAGADAGSRPGPDAGSDPGPDAGPNPGPDAGPNPGPDAAGSFRALRRDYLDRWTGLIADAQREGALPAGLDPRLTRDLLFGAVNAVGLAGRAPDEIADAVSSLLGLCPAGWPATSAPAPDAELTG